MRFFVEWRFHRLSGYTTFKELWKHLNPDPACRDEDYRSVPIVDNAAIRILRDTLATLPDRAAIANLNYERFATRNLWTRFQAWFVPESDAYQAREALALIADEYEVAIRHCINDGGFTKFHQRMVNANHKFFPSWKKALVCLALSLFFLSLALLTLGMLASLGVFGSAIAGLGISLWFLVHSVTIFFAALTSISVILLTVMGAYVATQPKISPVKKIFLGIAAVLLLGFTVLSLGLLAGLGVFGASVAGLASTKWLLIHAMVLAKLKTIADFFITPMTVFNFFSLSSAFFIELTRPGYANIVFLGSRRAATVNRKLTLKEMLLKILHFHRIVNKKYYVQPPSSTNLNGESNDFKFDSLRYEYEFSLAHTIRFLMNPIRWLEVPIYGISLLIFRVTDIGAVRDTKSHFWIGPGKMFPSPRRVSKEALNKFYEAAIIPALTLLNFFGDLPYTLGKFIIFDTIYSLAMKPPVEASKADLERPYEPRVAGFVVRNGMVVLNDLSSANLVSSSSPGTVSEESAQAVPLLPSQEQNDWGNREVAHPSAHQLASAPGSPLHSRLSTVGSSPATRSAPSVVPGPPQFSVTPVQ